MGAAQQQVCSLVDPQYKKVVLFCYDDAGNFVYPKGQNSREQIIEASASVLLTKGFSATTTADLTQAAQTSAGKLTHHFPTKASLLEAAFERLMEQFELEAVS